MTKKYELNQKLYLMGMHGIRVCHVERCMQDENGFYYDVVLRNGLKATIDHEKLFKTRQDLIKNLYDKDQTQAQS